MVRLGLIEFGVLHRYTRFASHFVVYDGSTSWLNEGAAVAHNDDIWCEQQLIRGYHQFTLVSIYQSDL